MALAWGASLGAHAQTASLQQVAVAGGLKEVVISGSRNEQDPDELPASIDVLNRKALEEKQIRDIRDAARDIPNVSVQRAPARFTAAGSSTGRDGNAGFNIRGLDGNRVLMLVDGIRQPRSYVFSANAFGRDYLDLGLVQRVEIVKGATSALYGSDGMGGLVNFITSDPGNFLAPGKTLGGTASVGHDGDTHGRNLGATLAGRVNDSVQWLLGGNLSRSSGLDTMGTNDAANVDRTTPNPEKDRGQALLGKLVITPGGGQKHVITLEHVEKKASYNLLSAVAKPPLAATSTLAADSFTDMKRDRLTWNGTWRLNAAVADELQATLSYQRADSREYVAEDRNTAADRVRDTTYNERTLQANLQAGKVIRMGQGWAQKFTYGLDHTRADLVNLQTGVTPAFGESFPLKRFPDTKEASTAVYVQDEIIGGPWSITPGVRLDRFSLDAAQAGFSPPATTPAASISGSAISPKLGVLYRVTPQWSLYGNYARGFKAPNANQVNGFFENLVAFYKTVPNPSLKPEKSRNVELGARGRLDKLSLDVAAFAGRYRDFIEEYRQVGGAGVPGNPIVFQTVNIGNVRISGFEVKGNVQWGRAAGGQWSSAFGYGRTRGTDSTTGLPVNSINPSRLNAGLKYDAAAFSVRMDLTHRAAKKGGDIDQASAVAPPATQFATPAAITLDLSGQWRIRKDLRLNLGLFNLTDKKYWNWSDVRGLASGSSVADAYTQPGRYLRVSLVADF
ncbi:MAG: TonB-dependent hemoglobin/transferrin/lactoferrin family receptor [Ramlibacter sp.]|nr:TonB-dependent hemoglobin/transferrin/lactoferrin family receptor [Ramlibacter sp.]